MDADDLYGLPLERFIPERGKLAKELKAAGERDLAAEVAALRKPSVAAWAVNQLVRTQPKPVAGLLKAGDALGAAQEKVLAGRGDAADLRAGVEREREAVSGLLEKARGLLSTGGHELSPVVLDRVADTLHAAALDEEARAQVRAGRLVRELRHVGLGMASNFEAAPSVSKAPPPKAAARKERGAEPSEPRAAVRERGAEPSEPRAAAREPRAAVRARDQARREARIAEADARRRVDLAARALRAAEERRDRAQKALDEAKQDVKAAQGESKAAAAAHRKAQADLV